MARCGNDHLLLQIPCGVAAFAMLGTTAASAALAGGGGPAARIRAFKPVADAYVTAAHPRTNYGGSHVLRVDAFPETTAYVRFELKKVRGEITSVTLLLHPTRAGRASYAVRRVRDGGWRERRLTYMNAPQPSPRYAASKPVRRGVWSAIDVTPFVDGGGPVSFAVTTNAPRELSFGSRESIHAPTLVVRTDEDQVGDDVVRARPRRRP